MKSHADDFIPFLIDDAGNFQDIGMRGCNDCCQMVDVYCDKLENTAEWGGQAEIKALAETLRVCDLLIFLYV